MAVPYIKFACSDCGSKLHNNRGNPGLNGVEKRADCYCCREYKNTKYAFEQSPCSMHYVTTEAVRTILLDVIQRTASYVRSHEDEFIKAVREHSNLKQKESIKQHSRKLAKNQRRIAELDKMFHSLYEDTVIDEFIANISKLKEELNAKFNAQQSDNPTDDPGGIREGSPQDSHSEEEKSD